MIKAEQVTKNFGSFCALKEMNCQIPKGCIYGLIGSNGAGKSTFLRMITGVYQADSGQITLEGQPIYENPAMKAKIAYVPDELFFLPNASMKRMATLYDSLFPNFDMKRFNELTATFRLNPKVSVNSFSKGMKRQAAIILALCRKPEYIFFDETFDGLDPVMRNLVKNLIISDVLENNATAIITSHSLRELEDTCDQLALLHQGGIVFESDVQNLKTSLFRVQVAFPFDFDETLFSELEMLNYNKKGSVASFIVRGNRETAQEVLKSKAPILLDILPLSLEEVFVHEMGALGYAFENELN
ncbi:ABC transporter ATP-binding protein [Scatolibacter rhodanostii]|uniref:ABC transporter ATP-binding protein n=1 Tax=Scatolibacter rhodanostii TaxID=2014781 RepID=UPI000C06D58E|nr:ABC transporter ATP-binding protein [Scatolibacter rhodanostii]